MTPCTTRMASALARLPVPEAEFQSSLAVCIERFTVSGVANLLHYDPKEVLAWRYRRRHPKPKAAAAVLLLAEVPMTSIERLLRIAQTVPPVLTDQSKTEPDENNQNV